MSTITSLGANDSGSTSRGVINTNFTNLNTDKIETSVLDTDGTLAANSDLKVATQKAVKTYVDTQVTTATVESSAGTTHSLTTTAGQVVMVWAKGSFTGSSTLGTVTLAYNGVSKDTVTIDTEASGTDMPFALMYTETPGAGTANIEVTTSVGTLADVKIMVQKLS